MKTIRSWAVLHFLLISILIGGKSAPAVAHGNLGLESPLSAQVGAQPHLPSLALKVPTSTPVPAKRQGSGCEPKRIPDWVNTKPTVGISTESREQAEARAREQAIKNLEVELQSDFKSFEGETTGGKYVYSIESVIVEKVDISIAGLEITDMFIDECRGKYYALAAIDEQKAINAWKHDLREIDSKAAVLRSQLKEYEKQGKLFEKLLALFRLVQEEELGEKIEKRIVYVTKQPHSGELRSGTVIQTLNQYESLLASFRVEVSGDQQRAVEEPRLPKPLVLRVQAGETPLTQVPVTFAVQEGDILVAPAASRTDNEGKARTEAIYTTESEKSARILAQVDLEQISQRFPPALRGQLLRRVKQFSYEFHVLPPVYHLIRKANELTADAKRLHKQVDRFLTGKDPIQALVALDQLMTTQKSLRENAEQLEGLYRPAEVEPHWTSDGTISETLRKFEEIISTISLRVKEGNGQVAQFGRPLTHPLVAEIIADLPEGRAPIRGIPVHFAFEAGAGEVEESATTSSQGTAQATVRRVEPAQSQATIVASIAWEEMPASLPETITTALKPRLTGAKFTITPPWGCETDDPFDNGLYQVGCELAEQVNDSRGQETMVKEFIWSKTRERTPLSRRMEQNVAKALALTGTLRVIQQEAEANREIPSNVRAIVSGEYGLDHQKRGLWVDAKLVRKDNGVIESYLREKQFIPRSHIPQEALAAMEEQDKAFNSSEPVLSSQSTQAFDDWVEQFWHTDNPQAAFTIKLRPDRPAYRVGEKAVFRFRTSQDCYLTLVNIGTSGKWIMLLPNREQADIQQTLVKSGSERVIPSPEDPFEFEIAEPLGVERIKAICTTSPAPIVEGIDLSQGFFSLSSEGRNWRDIRLKAKRKPEESHDWATTTAQINTLRADQNEPAGQTIMRSRGLAIHD